MKIRKLLLLFLLAISFEVTNVSAAVASQEYKELQVLSLTDNRPSVVVCHEAGVLRAMKIVGVIIIVIKILVPILLIITGISSLTKAVLDEDDGQIKKSVQLFLVKFFVGAFVFFVPTIVYTIMETVSTYDESTSQFTDCGKCLTSIKTCDNLIKKYS